MIDVADRHTVHIQDVSAHDLQEMERRYFMRSTDLHPHVYWRMTDNWVELSLRFLTRDAGIREVKDKMTREILAAFDSAGLQIASGTYEIVGMPPIQVKMAAPDPTPNGSPERSRVSR